MNKIFFIIISVISLGCQTQSKSHNNEKNRIELLPEPDKHLRTEYENKIRKMSEDSLWNHIVFEKGGCLVGEQYVTDNKSHRASKTPIFSSPDWKILITKDKTMLTDFLIGKLSDTTKTEIHTCPFFRATNGEMAVYTLQYLHHKNWYDFPEFNEFKDKEYKSATEQPQIWLQHILNSVSERKKLAELYRRELKE